MINCNNFIKDKVKMLQWVNNQPTFIGRFTCSIASEIAELKKGISMV